MFIDERSLRLNQMVACDSCGAVAMLALAKGWRRFLHRGFVKHHCPGCAEHNEHVRTGLVYKTDPAEAVSYGDY